MKKIVVLRVNVSKRILFGIFVTLSKTFIIVIVKIMSKDLAVRTFSDVHKITINKLAALNNTKIPKISSSVSPCDIKLAYNALPPDVCFSLSLYQ